MDNPYHSDLEARAARALDLERENAALQDKLDDWSKFHACNRVPCERPAAPGERYCPGCKRIRKVRRVLGKIMAGSLVFFAAGLIGLVVILAITEVHDWWVSRYTEPPPGPAMPDQDATVSHVVYFDSSNVFEQTPNGSTTCWVTGLSPVGAAPGMRSDCYQVVCTGDAEVNGRWLAAKTATRYCGKPPKITPE